VNDPLADFCAVTCGIGHKMTSSGMSGSMPGIEFASH
jgi:hypothetical protein